MKITKKKYLEGFLAVTVVLALVRCIFPSVAEERKVTGGVVQDTVISVTQTADDVVPDDRSHTVSTDSVVPLPVTSRTSGSKFFRADGTVAKHPIFSVPGYSRTFSDQQDVQYASARKWGVGSVENRDEAEKRMSELVYVASNPYFHVDKLHNSIPYLVPRASVLLQDIGRSFFDSLQIKGIPLHRLIVTSVLRTKEDVARLRSHNGNATENSCHLYGTTFDVCYNRYKTVEAPGEKRRAVRNDTLKYVLAEVLRDMRESGRCHVKYEVHQGCFHITVK